MCHLINSYNLCAHVHKCTVHRMNNIEVHYSFRNISKSGNPHFRTTQWVSRIVWTKCYQHTGRRRSHMARQNAVLTVCAVCERMVSKGIATLMLNLGTGWWKAGSFTPRPLYSRQNSMESIKQKVRLGLINTSVTSTGKQTRSLVVKPQLGY